MDNIKFIQLLGSSVGYFYNVISDNTNTQILDPLTTVIRLSILSFKIYGTKISINYNKISIDISNNVFISVDKPSQKRLILVLF